jgi:hypothetical protein
MTRVSPVPRASSFWRFLKVAVALALALTPVVLIYRWLRPADNVLVKVFDVEPSTRRVCLVADTPDGPEVMCWCAKKVTPFKVHPGRYGDNVNPEGHGSEVTLPVWWVDGRRYGVLTRDHEDRWRVFWFSPEEAHLRGRYWVLGGGEASFDLGAKGRRCC